MAPDNLSETKFRWSARMAHPPNSTTPPYNLMLAALPDGVIAVSRDGIILHANPAGEEMFGYGPGELEGQPLGVLIPPESRDDHPNLQARFLENPVRMTMSPGREVAGCRANGTTFPVDVVLAPAGDDSGQVVALVRDLTRRKELETQQRHAEAESHRKQRLETVGTLIAGVAHDFSNLLVPILTFSELLEDHVTASGAPALEHLQSAAQRARDLCDQILAMSRRDPPKYAPLNPAEPIRSAVKFVELATPPRIRFQIHLGGELGEIRGDAARLQQVVMNLCTNAAQAMGDGAGSVRVSVGRCESIVPQGRPSLILSIEDDGPGVDPGVAHRIFDPFYSTRGNEGGTGLGLSVVQGIVKLHQGTIQLTPSPGRGARFDIELPADLDAAPPTTPHLAVHNGVARILVVEDDEGVGVAIQLALESKGHTVVRRNSLESGLDALRSTAPRDFDLIVADYEIPGRPRGAFLRAITAEPEACPPVLVCTGAELSSAELRELDPISAAVLQKPFVASELLSRVSQALAASR